MYIINAHDVLPSPSSSSVTFNGSWHPRWCIAATFWFSLSFIYPNILIDSPAQVK